VVRPRGSGNLVNENPYAPPKAEVELVELGRAAIERPREIIWAIWLAVLNYLVGLVTIVIAWDYFSRLQSMLPMILSQVFALVIMYWLYYKIFQGRNWARITWLVFSLFGLVMMPFSYQLLESAPGVLRVQALIGVGVSLAIIWLLFFSPGKRWFSR
jgi:hypothetical protein